MAYLHPLKQKRLLVSQANFSLTVERTKGFAIYLNGV